MIETAVSPASQATDAKPALALAALATLLASTCCVLPLALAIVGISGAWISRLRVLEPYSSVLIALALASLGFAAWRLFRPGATCNPDGLPCEVVQPVVRRWFWAVAVLALVPIVVPLLAPFFY